MFVMKSYHTRFEDAVTKCEKILHTEKGSTFLVINRETWKIVRSYPKVSPRESSAG
jgi:hypothetical protein